MRELRLLRRYRSLHVHEREGVHYYIYRVMYNLQYIFHIQDSWNSVLPVLVSSVTNMT